MRTVLALCVLGLLATPAVADVHTHPAAKVSIEIPSGWDIKTTTKIIVAGSNDKAVGLMFWMVDRKDAEASVKLLEKLLGPIVKDPKWDKPKDVDHNGLKGVMMTGTATVKNKPVLVMVAILAPTPTDKGVLIYAGVDQTKAASYKDQVQAIFASLKPIK